MKLGFLVNPIAGMGGKVGLKGTDGVLGTALVLGARPVAPLRAMEFLERLNQLELVATIDLTTCPGIMGGDEMRSVGLEAQILPMRPKSETTAEDTKTAVKHMLALNVDLIVFVGGDGTARDILDAMHGSTKTPVLGVPSGVKMYSAIFAGSPREAADIVQAFVEKSAQIMDFEIMDVDEEAVRNDRLSINPYGFLKGPFVPMRLLGSKQVSPETLDEHENQMAVAKFIVEDMDPNATYILGPGTTLKCIADLLEVEKTLLGVDIYHNKTVVKDVSEKKILSEIKNWKNTWIVLSPIGRQGMLLGHGNQQISPEIIRKVGRERIVVVATRSKIQGIEGGVLRVDTGDATIDAMLRGYIKVAVDYREWRLMEIQ